MKTKTERERDYWVSVAALRESQGVRMTNSELRAYAIALENHSRAQDDIRAGQVIRGWKNDDVTTDSRRSLASPDTPALDALEHWLDSRLAAAAAAIRAGSMPDPANPGMTWTNTLHDVQHARAQLRTYRTEVGK